MSSFFNNLVIRSFGSGEVIRPRTPSLFEPQSGTARLPIPGIYGEESIGEPPVSIEPAWEDQTPVVRQFGEMAVPKGTEPELYMRETTADGPPRMHESGLRGLMPERSPARFKRHPIDGEPKDTFTVIRPEHAASEPAALSSVQSQALRSPFPFDEDVSKSRQEPGPSARQSAIAALERPVAMTEPGVLANQRAAMLRSTAVPRDGEPFGSFPRSSTSGLLSPQPSLTQTARAPIQAAMLSMSSHATSHRDQKRPAANWQKVESEPTIQVTIGRIEVRAEQSSARPGAKGRPGPQAISLDEYLRQQTGRSGR